jgi:hypothetical protein
MVKLPKPASSTASSSVGMLIARMLLEIEVEWIVKSTNSIVREPRPHRRNCAEIVPEAPRVASFACPKFGRFTLAIFYETFRMQSAQRKPEYLLSRGR